MPNITEIQNMNHW